MTAAPDVQAKPRQPICVGLLATDPLRLIGLQAILQESLQMHTAELASGSTARQCRPDVVLVDAGLQSESILGESVDRVRRLLPQVPVVVLARCLAPESTRALIQAGALGFLPETAGVDEIRACLHDVLDGRTWLPQQPEQTASVQPADASAAEANLSSRFTPKEKEVLQWLTQGRSNREIAATMSIDEATVKAHLGRMLRKAKATNRVELTLRVLAEGV